MPMRWEVLNGDTGEELNWHTARPELVEGRAPGSWFDKYILSEPLMVRQAHHERRIEGLTTSE